MKPLEQPVKSVGGMIDHVTQSATGIVEEAGQKTVSAFGSGAKLLSGLAGGKGGDSKGEGKKEEGGDLLGTVKGGIHTRLLVFGQKLLQMGKKLVTAGLDKIKGMLTPKVKFKLGNEDHGLWVEKGKSRNVVMMASGEGKDVRESKLVDKQINESVKLRKKLSRYYNIKNGHFYIWKVDEITI